MIAQRQAEAWLDRPQEASPHIPDIVRRSQAGDVKAFEELYREHEGRVFAVCLRMIANTSRAEELTQDVFVRVWEMLGTFRGESAFSSWLHRVAVNIVLVDIRSQQRYQQRITTVDDLEPYDRENSLSRPGESIDLETAMTRLPKQARAIFVLHDIEGYRHEEIAKSMGLAVGTTKAQLHRARKLLREVLNNE
ncbi:MAG: sigma-70 family RNA polymerase sigma factor [Bacteroidota bacterium]